MNDMSVGCNVCQVNMFFVLKIDDHCIRVLVA